MVKARLSSSEVRELKKLLAHAGAADIHFAQGLIAAFACVDSSADINFIYTVLLGDNTAVASDIIEFTQFSELLDTLTEQTLNDLYEYRFKLPPKTQFNTDDFEANFADDHPIANWAKGLHTGLSFCCGRAEAQKQDGLANIYHQLLEFSCPSIFVFIDADVARAVHQNLVDESLAISLNDMMLMARKKLPAAIKDLIELAFMLVTDGPDVEAGLGDFSPSDFDTGMNDLDFIDQLLQESEEEKNKKRRIQLLEQAVNLGRSQLGSEFFTSNVGYFWGLIETRPFMRALVSLADAYRQAHARDKSLLCYRECLHLCPEDNLGVRYILPALLMEMADFTEALSLVDEHSSELRHSAFLSYSRALCLIALSASPIDVNKALQQAYKTNSHIPSMLLLQEMPSVDSDFSEPGGRNEAIFYASENRMLWRNVSGALGSLSGAL